MDDGGSTTNLLSPNKGMGVVTGVGIDNPSSQSVHGMDHTTTPNEETTSQIPNENESVREKNNETDEDEVQLTRKRKKTSKVWDDFVVVTLRDGKKKAECKHCESRLAITGSGPTSSYKRHLNSCTPHKQSLKNQQILNFQPSGCDVDFVPPLIGPDTKYDENKMREAIANWILSTEQPFATVEDVMFVKMMKTATPLFEKLSRVTITLQKRVLSFVHVPPPRTAVDIADGIYKCLQEWEIKDKIFTISVDNAAYNDKALRRLKETFSRVRKLSCGGRLFHIRCCAHILNLLVKDGLAIIDHIIGDVREGIKYINNSEGRRLNFSKAAHQMQIRDRKLMLDVPTRWNSTYDMLCMALKFKDAFPRYTQIYLKYAEYEPHFHHLPTDEDWENVQSVCTNIISGSDYPTANLYLIEVFRVKQTLDKGSLSTNDFIRDMVKKMKEKFDKYWGECHLVMAIASVLDPRFKMKLVEFCFPTLYQNSDENIKEVKNALYEMYSEYLEMHDTLVRESATHGSEHERNVLGLNEGTSLGSGWEAFGEFIKTADLERPEKSELDMYLEEGVYREKGQTGMESFNALEWWNVHKLKYRVLSLMARDVLAIPISTVASEATFSAGGRVIDPYRASLGSDTVQMLICGGDWIRQVHGVKKKLKKEEFPIEVLLPEVNTKFCVSEE
ncbi:zinc finger BED domain-containing protein RICESLEEPER 2-like [Lactuca sativa]|uniref:zinc finger BED domain-containing protein RICESLEEPER 2-like n=1 Tax=Lactuca sativa TaxID=4236 RepID=UPI0022B03F0C|nr:zinc finger BED domain-containing protein RICESLEEPER 2-like [Lactuca sativa]